MGLLNRFLRYLPVHPHPRHLKKVPEVHLRVLKLPVHLSALQVSERATNCHNDSKGSEACGALQSQPVPGPLVHQGSISKRNTTEDTDYCLRGG